MTFMVQHGTPYALTHHTILQSKILQSIIVRNLEFKGHLQHGHFMIHTREMDTTGREIDCTRWYIPVLFHFHSGRGPTGQE